METKKLYYEDSHLKDFHATVLSCEQAKGGWEVVLDATAFYPEGGGQACDVGTLGDVRVLSVFEEEEKTNNHFSDNYCCSCCRFVIFTEKE